ncbi:hypothetical protein S40293_01642 [Stachybotrys chartarum IBT 40293]|nr:hypothetical protein S40293_01642 [Stachybotrys chartarum IBT 40293]
MSSSSSASSAQAEGTKPRFFSRVFAKPNSVPRQKQLADQIAIVTSSSTAPGFKVSCQLLELGLAHLVMGIHPKIQSDRVVDDLRTKFPQAIITVWPFDPDSLDTVHDFAQRAATLPRIDMVILNPLLIKPAYINLDTYSSLRTNYRSATLLSILLLPTLKAKRKGSNPPVLTIVCPDEAWGPKSESAKGMLRRFGRQEDRPEWDWYSRERLLLAFLAAKLAGIVRPRDVLVNLVDPARSCKESPGFFELVEGTLRRSVGMKPKINAASYITVEAPQGTRSYGHFMSGWSSEPRYPTIWYTSEGRELPTQLWKDTVGELAPFGVVEILQHL